MFYGSRVKNRNLRYLLVVSVFDLVFPSQIQAQSIQTIHKETFGSQRVVPNKDKIIQGQRASQNVGGQRVNAATKTTNSISAKFDIKCSSSPGRPEFARTDEISFRSGIAKFTNNSRNTPNQTWVIDIRNVNLITANATAISTSGEESFTRLTGSSNLSNSVIELIGTVYNQRRTLRDCTARIRLLNNNTLEAATKTVDPKSQQSASQATTKSDPDREEQRRLAAAREEQRKIELQEKARSAADEKARAEAAAKQAAQERAERERDAREEQRRLAAAREEQRKIELQEKARSAADEKARAEAAAKQAAQERAERERDAREEQRRLAAAREEQRKIELQEKARSAADEKARAEAAAKRAVNNREISQVDRNTSISPRNEDPLALFDGAWVPTAPPGPQIFFNKISLGGRVVSLPLLGQAIVRISNGENGSNFQVSGQGFNCFYMVVFLRGNQRMIWDLKAGDPVCMPSNAYELIE